MRGSGATARAAVAGLGIGVALMLPATAAGGEGPPIQDVPALDQYREHIPTASGERPTGERGSGAAPGLSRSAREQLRQLGGEDATRLLEIATSPAYGAPPQRTKGSKRRQQPRAEPQPPTTRAHRDEGESAVGAGVGAAIDSENGRSLLLLIVLGAITLAAVAAAILQRAGRMTARARR